MLSYILKASLLYNAPNKMRRRKNKFIIINMPQQMNFKPVTFTSLIYFFKFSDLVQFNSKGVFPYGEHDSEQFESLRTEFDRVFTEITLPEGRSTSNFNAYLETSFYNSRCWNCCGLFLLLFFFDEPRIYPCSTMFKWSVRNIFIRSFVDFFWNKCRSIHVW